MHQIFLLLPILLIILGAIIIRFLPLKEKTNNLANLILVIINAILIAIIAIFPPSNSIHILNFNDELEFYLHLDGLGRIFSLMIALLWPFAFYYSLGYMQGEKERNNYNFFYVLTFAIVLGVCYAGNLVSLYLFYECLTLVTLPLIMHSMSKEAKKATRFYLYISVLGSTIALMGMITFIHYFGSVDFKDLFSSDLVNKYSEHQVALSVSYLLMFFGFGVKAAIFPFHLWLPKAGVAPTPTTALLHAVAVVKSGAFAIIRVIYYVIGASALKGTSAQIVTTLVASFTIAFSSSWALKNLHLKRRYAYSTSSNISYILLAATFCSKLGLLAAMLHFIVHSFAKITIFFVVGGLNKEVGIKNCNQVCGLGRKMKITFLCFTFAGLSLSGIPIFAGFISKWQIAMAAIDMDSWYSYVGLGCVMYSALLTATYVLGIPVKAFFKTPKKEDMNAYNNASELNRYYLIPICLFAFLSFALGFFGKGFINLIVSLLGIGG